MIVRTATFISSTTDLKSAPLTGLPEFAFIGRSNVGKSSLVNMLVGRKGLAKTSARPGKTQTINHFLINEKWYLVDLPGYGYASVGRSASKSWPRMISAYLMERKTLANTFVLLDCRLEPQKIDKEFIAWAGELRIPFSMVFTKTDKLSKGALDGTLRKWTQALGSTWAEFPPMFATSATNKRGKEELLNYIGEIIKKP
jgi:GTP-binding protein